MQARCCPGCSEMFLPHYGAQKFCGQQCRYANAPRRPIADRLWSKVDRSEACWDWTGTIMPVSGYGQLHVDGRARLSHRVAWELASGVPLKTGEQVGHTCDNRRCVRNDESGTYEVDGVLLPRHGHLFLCTQAQNLADMIAKGRGGLVQHPPKGERNNSSKLTDAEVVQILAMHVRYGGQYRNTELAAMFGVKRITIQAIIARRNWAHIPLPDGVGAR